MFSDLHALSLFGVHSVYFACTQIIEIFVPVERFTANLEIQCEPAFVLRHGRWAAGSELLRVSPPCKCSLPQPNRIHRAQQRRRRRRRAATAPRWPPRVGRSSHTASTQSVTDGACTLQAHNCRPPRATPSARRDSCRDMRQNTVLLKLK